MHGHRDGSPTGVTIALNATSSETEQLIIATYLAGITIVCLPLHDS
jgi:hypothetical protein